MVGIKLYAGYDINELHFLGSGTQGSVYQINSQKCIKIFKREQACRDEFETLVIAQIDPHFPRLYQYGKDYIVREYIDGIELNKYLSAHALTSDISNKIIGLYDAMKNVGYNRLDSAIFHIFITPSNDLKLIDTSKALKKRTIYPCLIVKALDKLGYKKQFLDFVKSTRPDIYEIWQCQI